MTERPEGADNWQPSGGDIALAHDGQMLIVYLTNAAHQRLGPRARATFDPRTQVLKIGRDPRGAPAADLRRTREPYEGGRFWRYQLHLKVPRQAKQAEVA